MYDPHARLLLAWFLALAAGCLSFPEAAEDGGSEPTDATAGADAARDGGHEMDATSPSVDGASDGRVDGWTPGEGGAMDGSSDGAADAQADAATDARRDAAATCELTGLSDEFEQSTFESDVWQAFGAGTRDATPRLEDGSLLVLPERGGWFGSGRGSLLFQEVCGNFLVETLATVSNLAQDGAPSRTFHVAGIMARDPNDTGGENWVLAAVGTTASAQGIEMKSTVASDSLVLPQNNGQLTARLRVCRVANEVRALYHDGDEWVQLPAEAELNLSRWNHLTADPLQVGVAVSPYGTPFDQTPDLRAEFEYVRFLPSPQNRDACANE